MLPCAHYKDGGGLHLSGAPLPTPPIPLFTLRLRASRSSTQNSGPSGSLLLPVMKIMSA
jgi:hypothetical protein